MRKAIAIEASSLISSIGFLSMACINRRPEKRLGWIPWALRLRTLSVFALLDLALVICLIALSAISASKDGFVKIGSRTFTSLNITWDLEYLWKALTVLTFRLLGLYWEWVTAPISQRQPYVDLLKDGGAPAHKTVNLDYLAIPMLWRWWTALKNRHFLVSVCSLLTLIMSVVVSSLSASLFTIKTVPVVTEEPLLFNSTFNTTAGILDIDWRDVYDAASATLVNKRNPMAWTDQQYAFLPYKLQNLVETDAEVTTATQAYSAYLNCSILSGYQLDVQEPHLHISANDRGCDVEQQFEVVPGQSVYFLATSENACSSASWLSRLVVTAAMYSEGSPDLVSNLTVLSCIPHYRVSTGDLVAAATNKSLTPSVLNFYPNTEEDNRPIHWRTFEQEILDSYIYNYTALWSTSAFGNLVLYHALNLNASYLAPSVLQRAVADAFTTLYLTSIAGNAFVALETPTTATGKFVSFERRLHTVYWVTYLIAIILVFNLFTLLAGVIYVYSHPSILREEPAGLSAYATLLQQSPLLEDSRFSRPGESQQSIDRAEEMKVQNGERSNRDISVEEGQYLVGGSTKEPLDSSYWGAIGKRNGNGWVVTRVR